MTWTNQPTTKHQTNLIPAPFCLSPYFWNILQLDSESFLNPHIHSCPSLEVCLGTYLIQAPHLQDSISLFLEFLNYWSKVEWVGLGNVQWVPQSFRSLHSENGTRFELGPWAVDGKGRGPILVLPFTSCDTDWLLQLTTTKSSHLQKKR